MAEGSDPLFVMVVEGAELGVELEHPARTPSERARLSQTAERSSLLGDRGGRSTAVIRTKLAPRSARRS